MAWVRLDDQFARHPKMIAAKPDGMAMHVAAICYCNQYLTDGWVPADVAGSLLNVRRPGEIISRLCKVGAWSEHEGGYRLHDYLDFQPSREQVLADRKKARDRQEKARQSRRDKQRDEQRDNGVTHGGVTGAPTRPDPVLPNTPAADTPKDPSLDSHYAEPNSNGSIENPAAAEEPAREQTIRAACSRFGADPNIAEPWARQLTGRTLVAIVGKMEGKIRRQSVNDVPAQFVDLLKREVGAAHKAANHRDVHVPTPDEMFAIEARGLALTSSPVDVIDEMLVRNLTRRHIPEQDHPRLLELAHTVIADTRARAAAA